MTGGSAANGATRTAVVVGGGHNGLVAALRLARAGVAVTVVEQGGEPGGCVWTERHPGGVLVERGAFEHAGIRPLADELGLAEFGLRYVEHPVIAGFLFGDGERRVFRTDAEQTAAAFAPDDRAAYLELVERGQALFGMLGTFAEPPTLTRLAAVLAPLRGGDELFRALLMPAETVLDATLSDPYLRAALALQASHAQVPAFAPGSGLFAYLLPISHGSPGARPVGGSRALIDALVAALRAAGGSIRLGAAVAELRGPGAASGPAGERPVVSLADGDTLTADAVICTLGLPRTVALLADEAPALRSAARGLHSGHFNVSELTVTLVADRPFDLSLPDRDAVWYALGTPDDPRRGFGEIIAGRLPSAPWSMVAEVAQPDGAGGALWLSSVVPLRRADGRAWTPELERAAAERLVDHVAAVLGADLRAHLVDVVVSGPATWANRVGGDGNPNHLDNTLDQLFGWRPPGHAAGATELPWLFLAGAGQHPGGGLSGTSGLAAADAALAAIGRGGAAGSTPGKARGRRRGRVGAFGGGLAAEASGLWRGLRAYRSLRTGALR
ncbi:MAG: NAD(P)/FAD-dependent oxidoreductase [Frankia sp.]|nr:NAD(P)/FAD-dependent oxidoreductase [Frankia sp.]